MLTTEIEWKDYPPINDLSFSKQGCNFLLTGIKSGTRSAIAVLIVTHESMHRNKITWQIDSTIVQVSLKYNIALMLFNYLWLMAVIPLIWGRKGSAPAHNYT